LIVLIGFRELLAGEQAAGRAVGAFTCYDVSTAFGVVRAAERRALPVILLVSEASFASSVGKLLVAALTAVVTSAEVPAGVEAELGHVEGGEDVALAAAAGALTDPDEAAEFARATGADCLAVSIGNVHGSYAGYPRLDWTRLRRIRARLDGLPLSLHGASGLKPEHIRRAIDLGICKVNVNTELRRRYLSELTAQLPGAADGLNVLDLQAALVDAMTEASGAVIDLLGGSPRRAGR